MCIKRRVHKVLRNGMVSFSFKETISTRVITPYTCKPTIKHVKFKKPKAYYSKTPYSDFIEHQQYYNLLEVHKQVSYPKHIEKRGIKATTLM